MSAELDEAMAWIRATAARELREGRQHVHTNANMHRRELGLPAEPNLQDLKEAAQKIIDAYSAVFKKIAVASGPTLKQFAELAERIEQAKP